MTAARLVSGRRKARPHGRVALLYSCLQAMTRSVVSVRPVLAYAVLFGHFWSQISASSPSHRSVRSFFRADCKEGGPKFGRNRSHRARIPDDAAESKFEIPTDRTGPGQPLCFGPSSPALGLHPLNWSEFDQTWLGIGSNIPGIDQLRLKLDRGAESGRAGWGSQNLAPPHQIASVASMLAGPRTATTLAEE